MFSLYTCLKVLVYDIRSYVTMIKSLKLHHFLDMCDKNICRLLFPWIYFILLKDDIWLRELLLGNLSEIFQWDTTVHENQMVQSSRKTILEWIDLCLLRNMFFLILLSWNLCDNFLFNIMKKKKIIRFISK